MNLVIIDDEQVICNGLKKLIEDNDWGWTVCGVFTDPEQALVVCDWDNIQCALMDIKMPLIDGLSMAHILNKRGYETDIIFITAYSTFEFAQKAIEERPLAYLLKPVSKESLRQSLEKAKNSYLRRSDAAGSPEYIRRNLNGLRKYFFSDLIFREVDFSEEELARVIKTYFLENKHYALFEFISHCPRKAIKDLLSQICTDPIQWYLYGHDYFYVLLLVSDNGYPYVASVMERIDHTFCAGETDISDARELPHIYEDYLERVREHYDGDASVLELDDKPLIPNVEELSLPIRQVIEFIDSHMESPLSLQRLAMEVYLHPTYLSNLFKKQTGYTLMNYINLCRIRRAKNLLDDPSVRVTWVMERVGFANRKYFEKVFKEIEGMTPTQYKQESYMRHRVSRTP